MDNSITLVHISTVKSSKIVLAKFIPLHWFNFQASENLADNNDYQVEFSQLLFRSTKGQLISKCCYGVIISTKIPMSFLRTSGLDWYFNMSLGNVPNNILCDFRLTYTHASNQSHCISAMCSATLSLLAQCTVVAIF